MAGAFQNRRTRSTSSGAKPICAASWLARPPTSRPPIALGWPVSENGPMPGLPMRPVARCTLRIALTLSVPCADWLTPWLKQVTTRGVAIHNSKKFARSASARPQRAPSLARSGAISRARASASTKPVVCRVDIGAVERAALGDFDEQPRRTGPCPCPARRQDADRRSSAVAVRRGSMTTMRAPRCAAPLHALEQHRMAPGSIRADENDEIGLVEVLVAARHDVGAERAAWPATAEAMHSRELVSTLAEPRKPFISLLAT